MARYGPKTPTLRWRPTANRAEAAVADLCRQADCRITRRGWPDFFGFDRHGRPFAVEVKQVGQQLKLAQWRVLTVLSQHGLRCFVAWVGADGTVRRVRFDRNAHRPRPLGQRLDTLGLIESRTSRALRGSR
jgi:hypothetical protein